MQDLEQIGSADLGIDRDVFLRRLLRELTGVLQDVVGLENASGYVARVGAVMGEWLDREYRRALHAETLDPELVARVFVDLKNRIGGDFHVIDITPDAIVLGSRRCPFGDYAKGRDSLCQMTSNVFGRIAADNLGYARVNLEHTIARGDPSCRITVALRPREDVEPDEREYYKVDA